MLKECACVMSFQDLNMDPRILCSVPLRRLLVMLNRSVKMVFFY